MPAAVFALALPALVTCSGESAKERQRDWTEVWPSWKDKPAPYGPGTEFVLAEHRGKGQAVETSRLRCVLKEIRVTDGVFDCTFDDGAVRQFSHRLHPDVPRLASGAGGPRRFPVLPLRGPLVKTKVPAGEFEAARTTRSRELRDGTIVRMDEWWAPQIPFAVQRWERPEADVDKGLYAPPASPEAVPDGCVWAVLERMDRR